MAIKNLPDIQKHLFICNGSSCKRLGAEESTEIIRSTVKKMGILTNIHTTKTLCNGRCDDAPVVIAMPEGKWFKHIRPEYAEAFTRTHLSDNDVSGDHVLYVYGDQKVNSDSVAEG